MGMYYDGDNYVGDQPDPNTPDTSEEEKKKKKKKKKNKNENNDNDKASTASKIAKAGADAAGQMAAAHRQSWSGYSGGSTGVVDSSKNMTAVREPSADILTAAERKRLERMSNYG